MERKFSVGRGAHDKVLWFSSEMVDGLYEVLVGWCIDECNDRKFRQPGRHIAWSLTSVCSDHSLLRKNSPHPTPHVVLGAPRELFLYSFLNQSHQHCSFFPLLSSFFWMLVFPRSARHFCLPFLTGWGLRDGRWRERREKIEKWRKIQKS
jgi:hypothetical protein